MWGSYYNIPRATFYLLKWDYIPCLTGSICRKHGAAVMVMFLKLVLPVSVFKCLSESRFECGPYPKPWACSEVSTNKKTPIDPNVLLRFPKRSPQLYTLKPINP